MNTKNTKLTKEEKDIIKSIESREFIADKNRKKSVARYARVARATLAKNKTISIRISEIDLIRIKAKAAQEGMPYQTLISSSLHKMTTLK